MNILITGAAGFLGSHLVEYFLKEGHNVVGVDDLSGGSLDNLSFAMPQSLREDHIKAVIDKSDKYGSRSPQDSGNDFWFFGADCKDLTKLTSIFKSIGSVDVVYHTACHPHEGLSVFSPHLITESVYNASVAVFSAAISAGVKRIVYMSSMARYGDPWGQQEILTALGDDPQSTVTLPFDEDENCWPVDPYGIAKKAAEDTLKCLSEAHGIEYVIAVPHNIIGVRQTYDDPYRNVASIMMNRLKQGKDVIIYGDGEQTRCFSPIVDCIESLAKMADLSNTKINKQVINIGPDRGAITINELARKIYALSGGIFKPTYVEGRPREVKHATCSSDKARKLLGYTEVQDLDSCLEEMWNAIPEGGKPFEYKRTLEIINEKTPKTWVEKLI
jgi:UDP-glucose 4-epimerase